MKIIVFPYALAILKKVDAESLGPPPKFQVNIEIQLNTARVSRLSFRFLYYGLTVINEIFNFPPHLNHFVKKKIV